MRKLREKYALPKYTTLVPDKLEIQLRRTAYDRFHLSYKEYFSYLPNEVSNLVAPMTMNLMGQIGFPKEKVTRIAENGVGIELDGDFSIIAGAVMVELLMQKRYNEDETISFFSRIARIVNAFSEFSNAEFEWNSDIEKKYFDTMQKVFEIAKANPTLSSEMQAIMQKCAQSNETSSSNKDEKNAPETAS